jgi:hypothetical protein
MPSGSGSHRTGFPLPHHRSAPAPSGAGLIQALHGKAIAAVKAAAMPRAFARATGQPEDQT